MKGCAGSDGEKIIRGLTKEVVPTSLVVVWQAVDFNAIFTTSVENKQPVNPAGNRRCHTWPT
ncbi:hypothetical Protein YC6258_05284 [Gynuella sunshinyii YC6258]|uniref:Uncharacterized protein n=1 Tax=Gynuella sunshinyii YC6258 TaxID=1445510 RepID=A0A0C5W3X1_9GAMM|nr:hypothetical Protein YC6258_05284 [Gynuella sunshinyii YC6258]